MCDFDAPQNGGAEPPRKRSVLAYCSTALPLIDLRYGGN